MVDEVKIIRITTVPISLKVLLKGQLSFISNNGFKVIGVSSSGKELGDVKSQEEIEVYPIEMTRKISPFSDLISLIKFYNFCKKEKPLIVHSHTPKAGIIGMLGAKLAGVPIRMHTVAGMPLMEVTGWKRKLLELVEKLTYSCSTKVYPNSNGLKSFILENSFVNESKLKVLGNGSSNGIDTSYFDNKEFENKSKLLKEELGLSESDFVFVFVGRLVGDKGINELIHAFSQLKNNSIKLILVGEKESELDPLKEETIKEIDNNRGVIHVGFQRDVRPYLAISDALVFPSYREGFPNAVLQAGSMGLPSIVSDINGCNEIIVNGLNGMLVPAKDSKALYELMNEFVTDRSKFLSMKEHARKMITDRYDQKKHWNFILKEYQTQVEKLH